MQELLSHTDYIYTDEKKELAQKIWARIDRKISGKHRVKGKGKLQFLREKLKEEGYDYPEWYIKECMSRMPSKRRIWNDIVMQVAEKHLVSKPILIKPLV